MQHCKILWRQYCSLPRKWAVPWLLPLASLQHPVQTAVAPERFRRNLPTYARAGNSAARKRVAWCTEMAHDCEQSFFNLM